MAEILVTDDDDQVRTMIRMLLEKAGHQVTDFNNGAKALSYLESHDPDLLITDMYMPDLDGLELVRALRQRSRAPAIIGISGSQEPETFEIARRLGARATLDKPFTPTDLLNLVDRVLRETGPNAS